MRCVVTGVELMSYGNQVGSAVGLVLRPPEGWTGEMLRDALNIYLEAYGGVIAVCEHAAPVKKSGPFESRVYYDPCLEDRRDIELANQALLEDAAGDLPYEQFRGGW
jgi:hypothetical protein